MEELPKMTKGTLFELSEITPTPDSGKDILKAELRDLGLKEKAINFILNRGEDFFDFREILAKKLNIQVPQAIKALEKLKFYKNKQIPVEKIIFFEKQVTEQPSLSLKEIALLHDTDRSIVSAYLEYTETIPLTESQKSIIKEKYDEDVSISDIADQLRISQVPVGKYIEAKFITFIGEEGQKILGIITKNFEKYSIMELRKLISTKNVALQERLYCQLPNINEAEYGDLREYFIEFEESKDFFEIDWTLDIKAKECIRASSPEDIEELGVKLNRMQAVIREYLLQYYPDEPLMLSHTEVQLKNIQKFAATFGMDEQISHTTYRMIITVSFAKLIQDTKKTSKQPNVILNELLPLAFYYIKCSLPLEELSQLISNTTNISLTTLDLFHIIFQMSDPIVRGLCIEHYSFSNPVPFYYPRLEPYSQACQIPVNSKFAKSSGTLFNSSTVWFHLG